MWQFKREKLRFENMQNFDEISISQTERVPIEMLRIDLENQYQFVIFPQNTIFCSLSKYSHKVKVVHFISNFYFASSPDISIVIKGYLDVIGGFFLHCGSHRMTFLES